jgi:uncharacterized protein involved in exopolysaccharide biosynthesis
LIIVTEPRYQMRFDPRFQTAQESEPASKAFQTLATSDGVLQNVVDAYAPSAGAEIDNWRLATLGRMVEVSSGGDPSVLALSARSRSAQDAASIANAWANVVVSTGNAIYGESERDVAFFEKQVALAAQHLADADAALIEFEARNQSGIVTAQLESWQQAQVDYLGNQRLISYLTQDIQGLRDQLAQQEEGMPLSLADDLSALLLQIMAFNTQVAIPDAQTTSAPIVVQIDAAESLSTKSPAEQVAFLDELKVTLQAKSAEIDAQLVELEPQILKLQSQLQEISTEHDGLIRAQELAGETYLTLARKLDEANIAAQEQHGTFRVGSYAAVPERPVAPRRLFNTAVAGMLGLIVGVVLAFALDYWRKTGPQTPKGEEQ